MKPPLWRTCKVNAAEQTFATRENGVPNPLDHDGHVDTPQEVARILEDLVASGLARDAQTIGIEPDSC